MARFRVSITGYETYSPYDFEADKTHEEWIKDLKSAMKKAVSSAIQKEIKHKTRLVGYIGGYELAVQLVPDLIKVGYQEIKHDEICIGGECFYSKNERRPIIISKEDWNKIIDHNEKIGEETRNQRKKAKMNPTP